MFIRFNKLRNESGAAMVMALLVAGVLTVLGIMVFTMGSLNLQNASRDRLAGGAMGASEGGVAQAISFIRTSGVQTLTCKPAVAGTCSSMWGKDNPKVITLANGRKYSTWIEQIQKIAPPAVKTGSYRVHSTGLTNAPSVTTTSVSCVSGTTNAAACREIRMDINVDFFKFPIGVYADNMQALGSPQVFNESFFTNGCVAGRGNIQFNTGTDPFWNIPPAVHASGFISNGSSCLTESSSIHFSGPCNATYPADQDKRGGVFASPSACATAYGTYTNTSGFHTDMSGNPLPDPDNLAFYGYRPGGLSEPEYAALRTKAQESGTYYTNTNWNNSVPGLNATQNPNAVMYFDLPVGLPANQRVVQIGGGQFELAGYSYTTCGSRSMVIVIRNGDMQIQSGVSLVGATFMPEGEFNPQGTVNYYGTLFAQRIATLNGNFKFHMETCWLDNIPAGVLEVTPKKFHEVDR